MTLGKEVHLLLLARSLAFVASRHLLLLLLLLQLEYRRLDILSLSNTPSTAQLAKAEAQ